MVNVRAGLQILTISDIGSLFGRQTITNCLNFHLRAKVMPLSA